MLESFKTITRLCYSNIQIRRKLMRHWINAKARYLMWKREGHGEYVGFAKQMGRDISTSTNRIPWHMAEAEIHA
jgi:hypothetical protein